MQVLDKAGITDEESKKHQTDVMIVNEVAEDTKRIGNENVDDEASAGPSETPPSKQETKEEPAPVMKLKDQKNKVKKSVRFSEDTKGESPPSARSRRKRNRRLKATLGAAPTKPTFHTSNVFYDKGIDDKDDADYVDLSDALIPKGESAEDAAIRREMLKYNMSEVGAVVAELSLEEGDGDSDDWVDELEDIDGIERGIDNDDDSSEEDELGRSTRRVIDDAYLREMEALQRRINARDIRNVGPKNEATMTDVPTKRSVSKDGLPATQALKPPSNVKPDEVLSTKQARPSAPISDIIVEHAPSDGDANATNPPILEPDELDPAILRQAAAVEYNRMRNRMIYRQGGFLRTEEEEEEEEGEGERNEGKKMSRFKAARLRR